MYVSQKSLRTSSTPLQQPLLRDPSRLQTPLVRSSILPPFTVLVADRGGQLKGASESELDGSSQDRREDPGQTCKTDSIDKCTSIRLNLSGSWALNPSTRKSRKSSTTSQTRSNTRHQVASAISSYHLACARRSLYHRGVYLALLSGRRAGPRMSRYGSNATRGLLPCLLLVPQSSSRQSNQPSLARLWQPTNECTLTKSKERRDATVARHAFSQRTRKWREE